MDAERRHPLLLVVDDDEATQRPVAEALTAAVGDGSVAVGFVDEYLAQATARMA